MRLMKKQFDNTDGPQEHCRKDMQWDFKNFLQYLDSVKTYKHLNSWVAEQKDCHMLCGLRYSVMFTYCWQLLHVLEGRAVAKPRVICCSCITYFFKSKYQKQHQFAVLLALFDRRTLKGSCLCSRKKLTLMEKGAEECSDDGQEDTMQSLHYSALTSCCNPLPTQVPEPSGSHLAETSLQRAEEELIS